MHIVAVTACPTGIAHTYMAAAALEKAAKRLGCKIKVETQGAMGVDNKISTSEIVRADLVIFAVDILVKEEPRFKEKPTFKIGTQKTIKNATAVIEEALKLLE